MQSWPKRVLLFTSLLVGCTSTPGDPGLPQTTRQAPPTLLVVTLDTTRADALGVYGGPPGDTPVLDALATQGTRFTQAFSHAPSTQSAHTSLFTGLDPHGHRVPFNGRPLDDAQETLAERLDGEGWSTHAVVGAAVLGRSLGLTQGFLTYSDKFRSGGNEDSAPAVTARALMAAEAVPSEKPLFLWVHYFDPHHPYEPPGHDPKVLPLVLNAAKLRWDLHSQGLDSSHVAQLRNLYQAEVRTMDAAIGRLLAGLEAQGRLEDALIVVAGDHGEGFGELPERPFLHGSDVDPFATRIPLLFHGRGNLEIPAGTHDSPVALSDVSPTVLSLLDLEQGLGTGWDLAAGWKGGKLEDRPIFLEATKPRAEQTDGQWNNLQNERGVVWGEHLLMERVEHQEPPTLWRLGPPLVPQEDPVVRDRLLSALRVWDAAAPGASEEPVPAEVRPALEALGYLEPEKP